jgi:hypothetical protein
MIFVLIQDLMFNESFQKVDLRSKAGALERSIQTGACSQAPAWEHLSKIYAF